MIKQSISKNVDLPEDHNHDKPDDLAFKKEELLYPAQVEIENFWDEDVKIKNKNFSNEDYMRYKLKDWDVEKKLKKLFDVPRII